MAAQIWANIGSDNGLLPDCTKPLPEPLLVWGGAVAVTWEQFCKMFNILIIKICFQLHQTMYSQLFKV